jgi:hypothetical protein
MSESKFDEFPHIGRRIFGFVVVGIRVFTTPGCERVMRVDARFILWEECYDFNRSSDSIESCFHRSSVVQRPKALPIRTHAALTRMQESKRQPRILNVTEMTTTFAIAAPGSSYDLFPPLSNCRDSLSIPKMSDDLTTEQLNFRFAEELFSISEMVHESERIRSPWICRDQWITWRCENS